MFLQYNPLKFSRSIRSTARNYTHLNQSRRMTISKPSLLICGISGAGVGGPGAGGPSSDQAKQDSTPNTIMSDIERLRNEGHEVAVQLVDPNAPFDESNEKWRNAVVGKKFDGVSIGFGVRGNPGLTPLFEDLVNTAIQEIKPPPKLIFTENVDKLYVAVRRAFPKED